MKLKADWNILNQGGRSNGGPHPAKGSPQALVGKISAACTNRKHYNCYKLDCPCGCHNRYEA